LRSIAPIAGSAATIGQSGFTLPSDFNSVRVRRFVLSGAPAALCESTSLHLLQQLPRFTQYRLNLPSLGERILGETGRACARYGLLSAGRVELR